MTRIFLVGIVAVSTLIVAPFVGALSSVSVDPDQATTDLARTIFDAEEGELAERAIDRREENEESGKLEERRDDGREFFENKEEEE